MVSWSHSDTGSVNMEFAPSIVCQWEAPRSALFTMACVVKCRSSAEFTGHWFNSFSDNVLMENSPEQRPRTPAVWIYPDNTTKGAWAYETAPGTPYSNLNTKIPRTTVDVAPHGEDEELYPSGISFALCGHLVSPFAWRTTRTKIGICGPDVKVPHLPSGSVKVERGNSEMDGLDNLRLSIPRLLSIDMMLPSAIQPNKAAIIDASATVGILQVLRWSAFWGLQTYHRAV